MQSVTPAGLLRAWELGAAKDSARGRAQAILSAACPGLNERERGALSLGQQDRLLLGLRRQLFGSRIAGWVACPNCRQELEFEFDVDDLEPGATDPMMNGPLVVDNTTVCFKLPSIDDLADVASAGGKQQRSALLERVVTHATRSGSSCCVADLPEPVIDALDRALTEADPLPLADLELMCAACSHRWTPCFDMVSYLWTELDAWATRLLREVHCLARAYGWKESELLSMSPWRRHRYLELLAE